MGLDQWIKVEFDDMSREFYLRKNNVLRGYLINNSTVEDEDNCIEREIEIETIQKLEEDCLKVIKNPDLAEKILPIKEGFFFGTYDYDEWYWTLINDLYGISKQINELPNVSRIVYSDWW